MRWRSPCTRSRSASRPTGRRPLRACRRAVSTEITTSPRRPAGAPPSPSPCAKARTSVARSFPRQSRFSCRIPTSETSSTESSAPSSASPASRRRALRPRLVASPAARTPRTVTVTATSAGRALVRRDDLLHERVPHDVALREGDEANAVDATENPLRLAEARRLAGGQIDLRDVAGDDRLGAVAEPREEHLHLLGRGVLRLVEDDEAVVERAAAHERERRHLDGAALHEPARAIEVDHVVERIVERAEVGVHLL